MEHKKRYTGQTIEVHGRGTSATGIGNFFWEREMDRQSEGIVCLKEPEYSPQNQSHSTKLNDQQGVAIDLYNLQSNSYGSQQQPDVPAAIPGGRQGGIPGRKRYTIERENPRDFSVFGSPASSRSGKTRGNPVFSRHPYQRGIVLHMTDRNDIITRGLSAQLVRAEAPGLLKCRQGISMGNTATRPGSEDTPICPVMTNGQETVLGMRANCYAAYPVSMKGEACGSCALIDGRDRATKPI